jgi:ABC-2 type transport system permease protein
MALAGSDAPHLVEFDRQAEAYRYGLIQSLNDLHMHEVAQDKDRYENATEGAAPSRLRIDRRFFGELPAFDYHPPPVSWALRERLFGVLTALVATALSVGLLLWTAGRKGPVAA